MSKRDSDACISLKWLHHHKQQICDMRYTRTRTQEDTCMCTVHCAVHMVFTFKIFYSDYRASMSTPLHKWNNTERTERNEKRKGKNTHMRSNSSSTNSKRDRLIVDFSACCYSLSCFFIFFFVVVVIVINDLLLFFFFSFLIFETHGVYFGIAATAAAVATAVGTHGRTDRCYWIRRAQRNGLTKAWQWNKREKYTHRLEHCINIVFLSVHIYYLE